MSQPSEKEEKKKAAAPIPAGGGGGAGSSFSLEQLESLQNTLSQLGMSGGAAGGAAGAGGAAAAVGSKVAMLLVVGMLGAGAVNMRRLNAPRVDLSRPRASAEKPRYEGDLSKLPTKPQEQDAIQGVVLGDMTRKGDEEAAAAEAAARAEAEKQAHSGAAEDEAAKAAKAMAAVSASATPAMAAGDLTAKAAKMPLGKGNSPFDKKFGQLSASLGSGNAGGSAASSGAAFKPNATAMGAAKGFGAPPKGPSGMQALSKVGGGRGGKAFGQLLNVNNLSRSGAKVGGESGSSLADRGFSNGGGGGSAITGGGAGITGAGVFISGHDSKPSNGEPINQNSPGGTQAPPEAGHKNDTPWQKYVDIAMWCLLAAGLLLALAYIFAQAAKKAPNPTSCWQLTAATWCAYGAIAAGSVAAIMGAVVMGMGQTMNGLMYVAGGALIDYLAIQQLSSEDDKSSSVKSDTATKSADVGKTATNGTTTAPAAPAQPTAPPTPPTAPTAPTGPTAPVSSVSSGSSGLDFLGDSGKNFCSINDDPLASLFTPGF